METYQRSIELYIHSYQAQPLFAGCIFKYNNTPPNSLTIIKGNKAKREVLLRWFILQVAAFSMILRILHIILMNPTNENEKSSEQTKLYLAVITFLCYIPTAERYRHLGCSAQNISSFVNGLFLMKDKYFKDAKIKCPGYIRATIYCSRFICYACYGPVQVFLVLACLYEPTLPINVLGFLPNQTDTTLKFIQMISTAILTFIVWQLAGIAGCGMVAQLLTGMIPQLFCQKILTRRLAKAIEGNHSLDQLKNEFVAYRAFKLVVELFNDCVSTVLVIFLVVVGVVHVISTSLVIQQIKSDLQIPFTLNVFLVGMVVETFFINMCVYSFPGELYENSKESLVFLRRKALCQSTSTIKRKHTIAILRSCSVLKIKFGLSNFIEKITPPTYQLFCTDRIIDILLTQNTS